MCVLTTAQASSGSGAAARKRRRKLRFRHVRFNRISARLTYEGYPITITDFGLMVDASVYHNIDGSWRSILNK